MRISIFYFVFFLSVFASCATDSDEEIESEVNDITPSNLVIDVGITGLNSNNPFGDGSGVVNFSAQATNASSYGFIVNSGSEVQSIDGVYQYTFNSVEGIENHDIKVIAYSSTNNSINTSKIFAVSYYQGTVPVWADEFFQNGTPNNENWTYDLGDGGWGNNELQTYTNTSSNVKVEDGLLKIIAKTNGSGYTSSRLKSQGLFQFTYGRVDVRAKLPASAGTWPAIWMLGANFTSVGWPRCGEIDIMEQRGSDKNSILATCHWLNVSSSSYAGYGLETSVNNASSEFHIYSIEWNESSIKVFVDNTQYFVMDSGSSSIPSSPFQNDFFIILNIAMGGNLGGNVDSNFVEDTMEIDYIRVYQ